MSDTKKPTHKVFVVEEREGEGKDADAFWTRVGSAWPHKDGKGFNIVLSALPLNGRLVLREFTEDDDKADDGKRTVRARRLQETITVATDQTSQPLPAAVFIRSDGALPIPLLVLSFLPA